MDFILSLLLDNLDIFGTTLGIVMFCLCFVVLGAIGFPNWVIYVISGYIFGFLYSIVVSFVVTSLEMIVQYYIGYLFKEKNFIKNRISIVKEEKVKSSVLVILLLKLSPIIPFAPVMMFLGAIKYKFFYKPFLYCCLIGIPLNIMYCHVGSSLVKLSSTIINSTNLLNSNSSYLIFEIFINLVLIVFLTKYLISFVKKLKSKQLQ